MEANAFDAMLDFQNMYRAYRRAAAGKRDRREVIDFELDLSRNLWEIIGQMESRAYRVGGYRKFMVWDPKERRIEALSFRDRVVQHCLCDNILRPYYGDRLIYDNAACREGKGTDFARDRLTGFLREHHKWHGTQGHVLKYDIHHYFESIDHQILMGMLRDIPDKNVLALLYHIIESHEGSVGPKTGRGTGLPLGGQASQWFAPYYLDPLDRLIKERVRIGRYVRYVDDGVLPHESKECLGEVLEQMRETADELHLKYNQKTQIVPISQGVDFLGFRSHLTDTGKVIRRLRTSNKRRWKRRLKRCREEYRAGERGPEEINGSIAGYGGHLAHGHTWKLRRKVMGSYVLAHAPKDEKQGDAMRKSTAE